MTISEDMQKEIIDKIAEKVTPQMAYLLFTMSVITSDVDINKAVQENNTEYVLTNVVGMHACFQALARAEGLEWLAVVQKIMEKYGIDGDPKTDVFNQILQQFKSDTVQ